MATPRSRRTLSIVPASSPSPHHADAASKPRSPRCRATPRRAPDAPAPAPAVPRRAASKQAREPQRTPVLRIQTVSIADLNPAPYNPRLDLQPGDPEFERLARSVEEFGLVEPLVWNIRSGNLVGGHQRLKVLIARGAISTQASVVDLTPEREKALNLALNKIAGGWDQDKLAALLEELGHVPELDLSITGFEAPEIDAIIASALARQPGPEDFDLAAQIALAGQGPAITKAGEVITLGRNPRLAHRLICGDSTDHATVATLMEGQHAALFATDPPYLVDYDGSNHPGASAGQKHKDWSSTYGITWDDVSGNPDLYDKFIGAAVAQAIRPNAAWYCWHASKRQAMLEAIWTKHGAFVHCQIIWAKNRPVLTRTWYSWMHEPCLMGWIQGKKPRKADKQVLPTVWSVDILPTGPDRPDHPTPKPTELFEIPMRQHTLAGEICYEPFAGSGSQFIAAERTGRRCFGIEISPVYCDVIVRRFIAYAGEQSVNPALAAKYRLKPARADAARGTVEACP